MRRVVVGSALITLVVIAFTQVVSYAVWGGMAEGYDLSIVVSGVLIPLVTCFPISMFLLNQRKSLVNALSDLEQAHRQLQELAARDPMTGLLHRQAFFTKLASVGHNDGCLLMIDVDHFKAVNDIHGHAAGDQALRLIAGALADTAGETGTVARFGGEEFCIFLSIADPSEGQKTAEGVRRRIGKIAFSPGGVRHRLTVSIGVATLEPGVTVETAISAADAALYEAKADGRNRVVRARRQSHSGSGQQVA